MNPQDYRLQTFLHVSVRQLAQLSGISYDSWRSYLYRGAQIGEKNKAIASERLRMTPEELEAAIAARRDRIQQGKTIKSQSTAVFQKSA